MDVVGEENERLREPPKTTGLFRLGIRTQIMEFSTDGKALLAGGEPIFAVKDVELLYTKAGWQEFAERLAVHLRGVESELYRGADIYAVDVGSNNILTDAMDPGQVIQITETEMSNAYRRKYGQAVLGPFFL